MTKPADRWKNNVLRKIATNICYGVDCQEESFSRSIDQEKERRILDRVRELKSEIECDHQDDLAIDAVLRNWSAAEIIESEIAQWMALKEAVEALLELQSPELEHKVQDLLLRISPPKLWIEFQSIKASTLEGDVTDFTGELSIDNAIAKSPVQDNEHRIYSGSASFRTHSNARNYHRWLGRFAWASGLVVIAVLVTTLNPGYAVEQLTSYNASVEERREDGKPGRRGGDGMPTIGAGSRVDYKVVVEDVDKKQCWLLHVDRDGARLVDHAKSHRGQVTFDGETDKIYTLGFHHLVVIASNKVILPIPERDGNFKGDKSLLTAIDKRDLRRAEISGVIESAIKDEEVNTDVGFAVITQFYVREF